MLYPLKFNSILKDKIWGGTRLKSIFNKPAVTDKLGETWELSGYEGDESVVTNGFLAGNNLTELIEIYMGELVGDKIFDEFGLSFPLLFKLIDANDNLSIQVHPGDEVAAERHNSYGKTEMWYVVAAEDGAELIIGFNKDCTQEEYLDALSKDKVEDLLQKVKVKKGDVFFIPAGLVHAIGRGVLVAEIQQSSDITYRIYDYKRTDDNGNERDLHTEEALDVIDFSASKDPKTKYQAKVNESTNLISCDYFTTNIIQIDKPINLNYATLDSFVVYMCMEGDMLIISEGEKLKVSKGDTILIPASLNELVLIPENKVTLLEIYIKN
ncbi:MAG: mannose-6-phosphate isomerase [Paludibacter sp.]|nr:mannose-6-phosphate isomerase [Paludibacter sp.]